MTPQQFIKKWKPVALTERATAQTHFIDLCALVGHEDPVTADPRGESFTFEKGVTKTGGGDGFADVWKKGFFAWEYKKKKRNLEDGLAQRVRYAAALENPPLQVACDTDRFVIRTAWTNAVPKTYEFSLDELGEPKNLDILHAVFFDPEKLRPTETRAAVTKEAADKFSTIALRLQGRGTREEVAHFVNQLVFCFFANSVKLLPDDFYPRLLKRAAEQPKAAQAYFDQLFAAMEHGGDFGLEKIAYFNGGLFDGRRALPLDSGDIGLLQAAASLDWSQIDPTIFGTLFERFLDPDKRAQIGAHYTDPEKIMMIVDPVILRPLREEWAKARAKIEGLLSGTIKPAEIRLDVAGRMQAGRNGQRRRLRPIDAAEEVRSQFLERLRHVTILDPACGSGNFLYLALQGVKDIELKANLECEALGLASRVPVVGPEIVHGIEINPLAAELARTTIWIGDIQWRLRNGIYARPEPILRPLDAIECRDALITPLPSPLAGEGGAVERSETAPGEGRGQSRHALRANPSPGPSLRSGPPSPARGEGDLRYIEAEWPKAEFIVGNPPFLGAKWMLDSLGELYTSRLREIFGARIPYSADLVAYWFDKARAAIVQSRSVAAGLVATNMIRGSANRQVMTKIVEECQIFSAWADEPWVIDGAEVRVSIVCFRGRAPGEVLLNGRSIPEIFADLTAGAANLTLARSLQENLNVAIRGIERGGPFDISGALAREWLRKPLNPNGRPNSDVLRPMATAKGVVSRNPDKWIIDFSAMAESDATLYEDVYEYAKQTIKDGRAENRERRTSANWWLFRRSGELVRSAIRNLDRYIVTGLVWKHRIFVWLPHGVIPDTRLVARFNQFEMIS
jgi:type II restriction/modification system DNA methylase subunit YeeA